MKVAGESRGKRERDEERKDEMEGVNEGKSMV